MVERTRAPFLSPQGRSVGQLNAEYRNLQPLLEAARGAELPRTASGLTDRLADLFIRPSVASRLSLFLDHPITRGTLERSGSALFPAGRIMIDGDGSEYPHEMPWVNEQR
jgi:hypothetical protein